MLAVRGGRPFRVAVSNGPGPRNHRHNELAAGHGVSDPCGGPGWSLSSCRWRQVARFARFRPGTVRTPSMASVATFFWVWLVLGGWPGRFLDDISGGLAAVPGMFPGFRT